MPPKHNKTTATSANHNHNKNNTDVGLYKIHNQLNTLLVRSFSPSIIPSFFSRYWKTMYSIHTRLNCMLSKGRKNSYLNKSLSTQ